MLELSPADIQALLLTLKVAAVAVLAGLPVALATALLLARTRFPGKALLDAVVHLPLVLPPVVTGYLLLLLLGRRGWLGAWLEETFGLVFAFRWTGAALAALIMSFPLMVRPLRLAIESVDRRLEDAARTLGAPPPLVFLTITLPLCLPGLLVAAVLGFAKSLGEFGATITFVSSIPGETRTLASAIYGYTQVPGGEPGAMRLALLSIVVSLTALLVSEWLARRVPKP